MSHNRIFRMFVFFMVIFVFGTVPMFAQESTAEPSSVSITLAPQVAFSNSEEPRVDFLYGINGMDCRAYTEDFSVEMSDICATNGLTGLYDSGYGPIFYGPDFAILGNGVGSNSWETNEMTDIVYADGNFLSVENGDVCRGLFGNRIGDCYSFEDEGGQVEARYIAMKNETDFMFSDSDNKLWLYLPYASENQLIALGSIGFDIGFIEVLTIVGQQHLFVGGKEHLIAFDVYENDIAWPISASFDGTVTSLSVSPSGYSIVANYLTPEGQLGYKKLRSNLLAFEEVEGFNSWYLPATLWTNAGDMLLFSVDSEGEPILGLAPTSLKICHWTQNSVNYQGEFALDEECPQST